jgi:soluble lytic murein transglycosylase-like protein
MKKIIIFVLLLSAIYSYSYNGYYYFVFDNVIEHETGNVHSVNGSVVISPKGAIGLCQIMPDLLIDYNKATSNNYKTKDLYNKKINRKVGKWYFFQFLYTLYNGNIIKMVNAYNMGSGNTAKGKYNFTYLKDIIPVETTYWIRTIKVLRFYDNIWIVEVE